MSTPTHSRFPPSSASRWTECTASISFVEANASRLPPEGSVFADEGTKAHELAAKLLTGATRLLDTQDADMITHVRDYVEFVRDKVAPGDRLMVERRVPLFYLPEQRGTTDAAIIGPKGIYIADLKYGAGVSVYAKDNKQLAIYADKYGQPPRVILMQNHGLIALGRSPQQVENITLMMVKTARILLGAIAAGGPRFMAQADVDRIHTRPDELYRRQRLGV